MTTNLITFETMAQIEAHAAKQPTKGDTKIVEFDALPALAPEGKPFPCECLLFRGDPPRVARDIATTKRITAGAGREYREIRVKPVSITITGQIEQAFTVGLLCD